MAARTWGLLLLSILWALPAGATEKTIGRQVQSWRPRPLVPMLPEPLGPPAPLQIENARGPDWEALMLRILHGQPLIAFQPSWKGSWPGPRNPWNFSLTPGMRGEPSAGFGAELMLSGAWTLAGFRLEADSQLLWARKSGISSWRAAVIRGGWSFEGKGWVDDALRPGEWRATVAFRQPF